MSTTKDLGLVQAIKSSLIAPINTKQIWYDENVNLHKYYDTIAGIWKELRTNPSLLVNVKVYSAGDFAHFIANDYSVNPNDYNEGDVVIINFATEQNTYFKNGTGNSGIASEWDLSLYQSLIQAGTVNGTFASWNSGLSRYTPNPSWIDEGGFTTYRIGQFVDPNPYGDGFNINGVYGEAFNGEIITSGITFEDGVWFTKVSDSSDSLRNSIGISPFSINLASYSAFGPYNSSIVLVPEGVQFNTQIRLGTLQVGVSPDLGMLRRNGFDIEWYNGSIWQVLNSSSSLAPGTTVNRGLLWNGTAWVESLLLRLDFSNLNMFFGSNPLTSGASNVGYGGNALGSSSTGSSNTAVGSLSAQSITTASFVTAIGALAVQNPISEVTGITAVGYQAGRSATNSSYGVFIGVEAGISSTASTNTTNHNIFIGYRAGRLGAGVNSIAIGVGALQNNPNFAHIAIGTSALAALTAGDSNVAIGAGAADAITNAFGNVLIGTDVAGGASTSALNQSTFIGHWSGFNSRGTRRIAIGFSAAYQNGHDDTIVIGSGQSFPYTGNIAATTGPNQMAIGTPFSPIYEVFIGLGAQMRTTDVGNDTSIQPTPRAGINQPGNNLIIRGGYGTGAQIPGGIVFQIGLPGVSGSAPHTPQTAMAITPNGGIEFYNNVGFYGTTATTKATALTVDSGLSAGGTYGVNEQTIINNLRTRVLELEAKLQAYGLLS